MLSGNNEAHAVLLSRVLTHPGLGTLDIKGTVSRDFLLQVFFSWITFPQAPDNNIRIISNFFENSRRYLRCTTGVNDTGGKLPPVSRTLAANLPPVSRTPAANFATSSPCVVDTGGKFATGVNVNYTGGKFAAGVNDDGGKLPLVSTTPVANLPPVSMMGTISGCRHLKVNLKAKIYIYVSSTTQRWPNKIIKIFLTLSL